MIDTDHTTTLADVTERDTTSAADQPAPTKAEMLAAWREYKKAWARVDRARLSWYRGPSYHAMYTLNRWGSKADSLICRYSEMDERYAAATGSHYVVPAREARLT